MDAIILMLASRGVKKLFAEFIPTAKNKPAEDFFAAMDFAETGRSASGTVFYELDCAAYNTKTNPKVNPSITINRRQKDYLWNN